jgi:hypothetical protein
MPCFWWDNFPGSLKKIRWRRRPLATGMMQAKKWNKPSIRKPKFIAIFREAATLN